MIVVSIISAPIQKWEHFHHRYKQLTHWRTLCPNSQRPWRERTPGKPSLRPGSPPCGHTSSGRPCKFWCHCGDGGHGGHKWNTLYMKIQKTPKKVVNNKSWDKRCSSFSFLGSAGLVRLAEWRKVSQDHYWWCDLGKVFMMRWWLWWLWSLRMWQPWASLAADHISLSMAKPAVAVAEHVETGRVRLRVPSSLGPTFLPAWAVDDCL